MHAEDAAPYVPSRVEENMNATLKHMHKLKNALHAAVVASDVKWTGKEGKQKKSFNVRCRSCGLKFWTGWNTTTHCECFFP